MKKCILTVLVLILILSCACNRAGSEESAYKVTREGYWILIICDQEGHLGYYDILSGHYEAPKYDGIFDNPNYDAPILVERDGLWGYIDKKTGKEVIPLQYSASGAYSDFQNGYAVAGNRIETNDNSMIYDYFLIDLNGRKVDIGEYCIKSGVCGSKQSIIVSGFNTKQEYGYGIYRIHKGIVVEPEYESIWFGDCNYFCFRDASGMIGLIDADGKVVLEPQFFTNSAPICYLSCKKNTSDLHVDGYYEVYDEHGNKIYIFIDNDSDSFSVFDLTSVQNMK